MFGAFRCSNGALNNHEYIDLSGNSGVDARNYTAVACDSCRARKLKCSGDLYGCERCRATSSTCTYQSSATGPSRNRQSWSALSSTSPAKKQTTTAASPTTPRRRTGSNGSNGTLATSAVPGISISMNPPAVALGPDPNDSFWTNRLFDFGRLPSTPSGPVFVDSLHNWGEFNSVKDHHDLTLDENCLPMITSLPKLHNPSSASKATSTESGRNSLAMTTPTAVTSQEEYRSRRCECVRSLADALEKIGDDGGIDEAKGVDDLLLCLRGGVDTCKRVLACDQCAVCVVNSMLIVTIVQQLATVSSDLCRQLLVCQQKSKTPASNATEHLLNGEVYLGKYQVQAAEVCLDFVQSLVSMHLKDFQRLMDHLRDRIGKRAKASRLLRDAAEETQKAFFILQEFRMGRSYADILENIV